LHGPGALVSSGAGGQLGKEISVPVCNCEILSEGIAKLILWPPVICSVATPMTWPCMFTTGLPLEPGEMGAVI